MSRQKLVILAIALAIIGGAIAFVVSRPKTKTYDSAAGASLAGETEPAAALWARMAKLHAWLPTFEEAFKNPEPEPRIVLAAFATLAEKVGGASGFWRDTVPNELLTCFKQPDQAVCKRLTEALPELTDGESLARSIGRLDDTRANLFLERNAEQMLNWVETFAPTEPTAEAMRLTSFWETKLAPAVAGQQ